MASSERPAPARSPSPSPRRRRPRRRGTGPSGARGHALRSAPSPPCRPRWMPSPCRRDGRGSPSSAGATRSSPARPSSTRRTRPPPRRRSSSATTTTTSTSSRWTGRRGRRALAGRQPRVHQRDHHVPADDRRRRRSPSRSASRWPRTACPWSSCAAAPPGRPWSYVRDSALQPPDHRADPVRAHRPRRRHPLLKTADDPAGRVVLGTLNNCAGGTTPWGTVLSGEENFNQYFVANATARDGPLRHPDERRRPRLVDGRPALRRPPAGLRERGQPLRLDRRGRPRRPHSTPVKHTALGRFKHEGATIRVADDGRVVAYSGDDERFDYVYKFVSSRTMRGTGPPPPARTT